MRLWANIKKEIEKNGFEIVKANIDDKKDSRVGVVSGIHTQLNLKIVEKIILDLAYNVIKNNILALIFVCDFFGKSKGLPKISQ